MWAQREVEAQRRWETHVAPMISRLDPEIARHEASLDGAANRFERRLATSRMVIGHGLEQQRHAKNLAHRVAAERNHLDRVPSTADLRQVATRKARLQGLTRAPTPEPPARHLGSDL